MRRASIIGASALPVGRMMPGEGATGGVFEAERLTPVIRRAIEDAGVDIRDVASAVFAANPPTTPQLGFSVNMAARLGLKCKGQLSEVANLGISGGLAFDQAVADVELGRADIAIAAGILYQSAIKGHAGMEHGVRAVGDADWQAPFGFTPISWYALDAARYFYETGLCPDALSHVAVKSRCWSMLNPIAQFREPLSVDEARASDFIVDPLRLHDIPQRADGAVCLVIAREEVAASLRNDSVRIAARSFAHDGRHQIGDQPHDMTDFPAAREAVHASLNAAGLNIKDFDIFELYAPCTITEVLVAEAVGLFGRGRALGATKEGRTAPGGDIALNTSGGCLARGHPPTITGLYGLYELFEQLRGGAGARQVKNAMHGLHICELGNYNAALVHVLERAQ